MHIDDCSVFSTGSIRIEFDAWEELHYYFFSKMFTVSTHMTDNELLWLLIVMQYNSFSCQAGRIQTQSVCSIEVQTCIFTYQFDHANYITLKRFKVRIIFTWL